MENSPDPQVISDFERETWSQSAESYPETFALITSQNLPHLLQFVSIQSGMSVLDVGCGPGDITNSLADLGADVTGVDFAEPMIEVAKRRFPNLTFQQADIEKLPFEADTFDIVLGNMVVHHFARPQTAFQEACRVLKPGGTFAFIVPIPDTQTSFTAFSKALVEHVKPEAVPSGPLYNIADESVYENLLTEAGFTQCQFDHPELVYNLPDLDPLLRGGWEMAKLYELPQDVQDNIRKDTIMYAEPQKRDGFYEFRDVMFMASAQKP